MERVNKRVQGPPRSLVAMLLLAGAVVALAIIAPQAWATPSQDALRATVPPDQVFASDSQGDRMIGCFRACDEPVYVVGDGFPANATFTATVTSDTEWVTDTTTLADVTVHNQVQIQTDSNGDFGPTMVWYPPLFPGNYDVFFDVGGDAEEFDDGDAVINPWAPGDAPTGKNSYGFCVEACPAVGGVTTPVSRIGLAVPFLGLLLLIGGGATGVLMWRRRS